jgi:poly-beta-1,6-N-acetyl-D-glucosamine synthase
MSIVKNIIDNIILFYAVTITISYLLLGIISAFALINYKRKNSFIDYNVLLTSPFSPWISIIAPAYNESKTIVDNISALLALRYNHFEVIIVNDGSRDDTLEKIINEYQLEKVDFAFNHILKTRDIRGIYRSCNDSFANLIVIDKVNGGKADALNAGINIARNEYFIAVDVDSVIEPDALLKLVKPILESSDARIIATGGVIRIANSCEIINGNIVKIHIPKNLLARFQVLEYTRAFLIGRIAWSKLNGLLIISGALGLFDKQIVIECGGYNNKTVGEDMELVVRMRRYMYEKKIKHRIVYIPDPLCWTEAPTTLKILGRQRNRWTRGTMDSLVMHRKIFLNPRYGMLGLLGHPYWLIFEWFAPIIEFLGIFYLIILVISGSIQLKFFLLLFSFVYLFSVAFSSYAILYDELTFYKYQKRTHIIKLILTSMIEPIIYHPFTVFWAIQGNISYLKGVKTWGEQERKGFQVKL